MSKEEMNLALEALGLYQAAGFGNSTDFNKQHEAFYKAQTAIAAIKQALAAPVQEPVAGVVLRDGYPTLIQDNHIKETDQRLCIISLAPKKGQP